MVPFLDSPIATWNLDEPTAIHDRNLRVEFPLAFRISLSLHFDRASGKKEITDAFTFIMPWSTTILAGL